MIENICNVFIFVDNQENAKKFWTKKIGFEIKIDTPMQDNYSWIEVVPKTGQTTLVLYPKALRKDFKTSDSTITFFTKDIEKTFDELSSKGVKFSKKPENTGFGIFTEFYDEDGNTFSLKQV